MKRINKYGCFKSDDVCIIHDCPLLGDNFCEESEIIKSYKRQIIQDLLDKLPEEKEPSYNTMPSTRWEESEVSENSGYNICLKEIKNLIKNI
jgi:hypothetical protein